MIPAVFMQFLKAGKTGFSIVPKFPSIILFKKIIPIPV